MTLEALLDLEAIRRLIVRYAQLLDDGAFAEWSGLFVADAVFSSVPGNHLPGGQDGALLVGREAIVASVAAVQRELRRDGAVLHLGGAPLVDLDGETARAQWDFLVVHAKAGEQRLAFAGRYHADLRKEAGNGWRFVRRVSCALGHGLPPGGAAGQRRV